MSLPFFLLLCIISLGAASQKVEMGVWTKHNFPNPQRDFIDCGRQGQASLVCDPGQIISPAQADKLDEILSVPIVPTSCVCNCLFNATSAVSISVALISEESPYYSKLRAMVLVDLAEYLATKRWAFSDCDANIVIVSSTINYTQAMVSTFVEDELRTKVVGKCVQQLHEAFAEDMKSGDYYKSLEKLVVGYRETIEGKRTCPHFEWSQNVIVMCTLASLVVMSCLCVCVCPRKKEKKEGVDPGEEMGECNSFIHEMCMYFGLTPSPGHEPWKSHIEITDKGIDNEGSDVYIIDTSKVVHGRLETVDIVTTV